MRTLIKCCLILLLLTVGRSAFATTVDTKTVCAGTPIPNGWILTNYEHNPFLCSTNSSTDNVWTITEYDNLPVGMRLNVCFANQSPNGWLIESFFVETSVCGNTGDFTGPINAMQIEHVTCVNEASTLCYPPPPAAASITASPAVVNIPYGQTTGSSTLTWAYQNNSSACVWVISGATTTLWSCSGASHSQVWPYVQPGLSQTFIVTADSKSSTPSYASVVVKGVQDPAPTISASPTVVSVPTGTTGSSTISYNLTGSGYSSMCIWVSNNGAAAQLWACGAKTTFSQVWPYVPKGGKSTLWLSPTQASSTPILAAITVTGQ